MTATTLPATPTLTTYDAFLKLVTGYLQANDKLFRRDLPSLFPDLTESQLRSYAKIAIQEGRIIQGQSGYQGPWFFRQATVTDQQTGNRGRIRRNLDKEIPPKLLAYLASHGFISLGEFKSIFKLTNATRAQEILKSLLDSGQIVLGADPRPGTWKKKTVYMSSKAIAAKSPITVTRRTRSKSTKYYDLQSRIPQLLQGRPEGLRYLSFATFFNLNRNDATLIQVLKDLVTQGILAREEGKNVGGRVVTYRLANYPVSAPVQPVVTTPVLASPVEDERDQIIAALVERCDRALSLVSTLQSKVSELEQFKSTTRPLPTNLQERLRQLQAKDQQLTGNNLALSK